MLESIALMNGMSEKMKYLQTRQRVLAQNITNADSPGYQPMDVSAPDFSKSMAVYQGRTALAEGQKLAMTTTSAAHVNGFQMMDRAETGKANRQPYEIKPTSNGVTMEEQMMNASKTAIDYQLVTNIYGKNLDMLRSAMKH
ncbi:MAG: flgB [Alphaproteobacteria bacterium]|nr:flgB [Alphaproteobacteria bacterium]